ncbi:MAG: class I SAM-dependent methyltransferase [Salibacteraceae bacterium]
MENKSKQLSCWVCDHNNLKKVRESKIDEDLKSENFFITNSDYGKTAAIYKCSNCGFLQCPYLTDVISFYEQMEDNQYEEGRDQRLLQERKVMEQIQKIKPGGKLLDIGAGSGILVQAALELGYDAEGVEPSKWLHKQAQKLNLPVELGIFPQEDRLKGPYDVVTLVDVIEHVGDPKGLVKSIREVLKEDGILIVVTPDVDSVMAKTLKYKWWHFRIAHIGYFNKKNLNLVMEKAGFSVFKLMRPTWFFSVAYLLERVSAYLPGKMSVPAPKFIKELIIPINLRDSWMGIYKKGIK